MASSLSSYGSEHAPGANRGLGAIRPIGWLARLDNRSAELFSQRDDDALGAADVTESIDVLVLHHIAKKFGTMCAQADKDIVDVIDGEHDAPYAQRVRRCVYRLGDDRR